MKSNHKKAAFTLVDLVVVVLILGLLAGVAAPKFLNTSKTATESGLKQTLTILRDAIELYTAENGGTLPPCVNSGTSLQTALAPYIRGQFPLNPIAPNNDDVEATTTSPVVATASAIHGWKYNTNTGEIICNSDSLSSDGTTTYDAY